MEFDSNEIKKMIIKFLDRLERKVRKTEVILVDDYSSEIRDNRCDFFIFSDIDNKPRFTEGYYHFNNNYVDEIALGKTYETETLEGLSDYDPAIPVFHIHPGVHQEIVTADQFLDEFLAFTKITTTNVRKKENLLIPVSPEYKKFDLFPIVHNWNIDAVCLDRIDNFASYGEISIISLDANIIVV